MFSALPLDEIDFDHLKTGVAYYNRMIKLRLNFIHGFEDKHTTLAEFESICLQTRKIVENVVHYYTFLFQETTNARLSQKKAIRNYNADKILEYMSKSGYVAIISSLDNISALERAGMRRPNGNFEILTHRFYRSLYGQLGSWLHEPPRTSQSELDPTVFTRQLYEKIQKIDASMWRHTVPSKEFSISVSYGKRNASEVIVAFNDLR